MFRKAPRIFIAVLLIATAQAALAEKRVALVIGNGFRLARTLDEPPALARAAPPVHIDT